MRPVLIVLLCLPLASSQSIPTYKTVVHSEGDFRFPLQSGDRESYEQYCPKDTCTCEADISYVQLTVPGNSAVNAINQRLRKDASRVGCAYLHAIESMREDVTHLSAHFVSVVEIAESLPIGGQGSCHESSVVHTFDLASGREYRLADVISKSSLSGMRSALPKSLVDNEKEASSDPERDLKAATSALAALSDEELMKQSLLIRAGRLFTDVEGYLFGCVGGTLHVAEIPASMITSPLVRRELHGK